MSPTYTGPAVETIHQGEQLFTADFQQPSYKVDGPRDRVRPSSSRSETYSKKHRFGSPQVHPLLKNESTSGTERSSRPNSTPVQRPSLRRYSSEGFSRLTSPSIETAGEFSFDELRAEREQKRARLSPTSCKRSRLARSSSFQGVNLQLDSSSDGASTLRESDRENEGVDHFPRAERAASVVDAKPEVIPEDMLRYLQQEAETAGADDPNLGRDLDNASWLPSVDTDKTDSPNFESFSSVSSNSSSIHSATSSQGTADTETSTTINGEETPVAGPADAGTSNHYIPPRTHRQHSRAGPHRYGTPEMPRGPAKLPHIPMNGLTPRVPNQGHPKHLPRAEKLPMSGYELLASTISSSALPPTSRNNRLCAFLDNPPIPQKGSRRHSSASFSFVGAQQSVAPLTDECTIKPIYRRFESLNHRLLLHLQDELSELEEQLHRLDTTDTQTRRLQSSILPASRRAEFLAGGELQWHKTDLLSKISFKLSQYNHTLSSFTSTRDLSAPSRSAINEYREYLATHRPISDVETRFIDSTDDLVTLEATAAGSSSSCAGDRPNDKNDYLHSLHLPETDDQHQPIVTPIPGTMHGDSWLLRHNRLSTGSRSQSSSNGRGGGSNSSARSASSSPKFAPSHKPVVDSIPPPSPLRQTHRAASVSSTSSKAAERVLERADTYTLFHLALAMVMAVLVPVLTFSFVPGLVGRMSVVMLVGLSVMGSVAQSVDVKRVSGSRGDLVCSAALYAGVMAVVAGVMR